MGGLYVQVEFATEPGSNLLFILMILNTPDGLILSGGMPPPQKKTSFYWCSVVIL